MTPFFDDVACGEPCLDPGWAQPMNDRLPSGGIEVSSPSDLAALEARWAQSWKPQEVARRLAGICVPWYVAAGWALDLGGGDAAGAQRHPADVAS